MHPALPLIDTAEIETAARLLRGGRLVAFPTETVYGLGANALDASAVARIYQVKERPRTSPLIVHVASIEMAKSLAATWPDIADRLARSCWPGPLTLVLEKQPGVPSMVTAGLLTVGLRMPSHPIALALIRAAGVPVAAPSANRFTQLSPTTAEHVRASLGADVDYILDGGPCHVGIESTVISLAGERPVLLRPGGISRSRLEELIGPVLDPGEETTDAHLSPGMHPRHYSPRTKLLLVRDGRVPEDGRGFYLQFEQAPRRNDVTVITMPRTASRYAAALYDTLHRADASGCDWIGVDVPPETPEWEAVQDRLRRAASHQ